jgi:hypothetical protein
MLQLRLDDEFPRSLITTFFGYISNFSVNKHYYIKKTEEWTNYKLKCISWQTSASWKDSDSGNQIT